MYHDSKRNKVLVGYSPSILGWASSLVAWGMGASAAAGIAAVETYRLEGEALTGEAAAAPCEVDYSGRQVENPQLLEGSLSALARVGLCRI